MNHNLTGKGYKKEAVQARIRILTLWLLCSGWLIPAVKAQENSVTISIVRPSALQNFNGRLYELAAIGNVLHAQIQRTSGTEDLQINLEATLTSLDESIKIVSKNYSPIVLHGTVPFNLFGSTLSNFFDVASVEAEGIDRNELIAGGFVPEGHYRLCVIAYHAGSGDGFTTRLSNPDFSGCLSLEARYLDPPVITNLAGMATIGGELEIPSEQTSFPISWTPVVSPGASTSYKLELVDMGDFEQNLDAMDYDPNLAFSNVAFEQLVMDVQNATSVMVGLASQMPYQFQERHRYAVRVQAQTLGSSAIKNDGYSEAVAFWFINGDLLRRVDLSVFQETFPRVDTLPFRGMPVVVRLGQEFDPTQRNVIKFSSVFNIREVGGAPGPDYARTLKWYTDTPLALQRHHTGNDQLTPEQARHIAVSEPNGSNPASLFNHFQRGKTYDWAAVVSLTEKKKGREKDHTLPALQGNFVAGMSKPKLMFPADKSTLEKGDITFRYQTGSSGPLANYTPLDIVQAQAGKVNSFNVYIRERAVLEIADTVEFVPANRVLHRKELDLNKIILSAGQQNETVDWVSILNDVYKESDATFPFDKDGTYYWRVRWLKNPEGPLDGESYVDSSIWSFSIGEVASDATLANNTDKPPLEEVTCENCETVTIPATSTFENIAVGAYVKIGHFVMEISEIIGSATAGYSGKATVFDFSLLGFQTRLNVTFTGLKAVFTTIDGKQYLQAKHGDVVTVSRGTELLMLAELANSQPLSLPLGIDVSIEGHRVILQLSRINFTPNKAMARVSASWEPPAGGQAFAFSAREVCLLPGRLGNEALFVLDRSLTVNQGSAYEFSIAGAPEAVNPREATFLELKCDTISLQLAGNLVFPRSTLIPLDSRGKAIEGDQRVTGSFKVRIDRFAHVDKLAEKSETDYGLLAAVTLSHPFEIPGLEGWGFTARNTWLDLSEISNPVGMHFPKNYITTSWFPPGSPASMQNLWQGLYSEDLSVRVPDSMTLRDAAETGNPEFSIKHLVVDKTGVTVTIEGDDVLPANAATWDFTIDRIGVSVIQTRTISGEMEGRLRLPNFDPGNFLDYHMVVTSAANQPTYTCTVRVKDDPLKMSLWLLDVKLDPSSRIDFLAGRKTIPGQAPPKRSLQLKGILNGYLGIQENPVMDEIDDLMDLKVDNVRFENFTFDTDNDRFFNFTHINWTERAGEPRPVMAFASPQHSAGRLPISITHMDMVYEEEKPGLQIGAELNLSDMGFKAGVSMTIFGKMETRHGVIPENVGYDHIRLDSIKIDCDFSGFQLKGYIAYYKADTDKGYKGDVAVRMPMSLSGRLLAQFGSRGEVGSGDYFRYWFVDGMVFLKEGVPISPALELKAFGGGAWYHMTLANPNAMTREAAAAKAQEIMNDPDIANPLEKVPPSGLRFVPNRDTGLGLSVAAVFALSGDSTVFNMDVAVKAEFNNTWGLKRAGLVGNGYLLQNLDKREDPSIRATVDVFYNHNEGDWDFSGNLEVMVDLAGVVVGAHANNMAGRAQLYFDHTGKWFFKLGGLGLGQRIALKAILGPVTAEMNTYLMVGHDVPVDLPPLPPFIEGLLSGGTQDSGGNLTGALTKADVNRGSRSSDLENYRLGKGIAFGAHLDLEYDRSFLLFYAKLRLALGLDINLTKPAIQVLCENATDGKRGFANGWYGSGQAYAGFEGDFGIEVDLLFFTGRINIATVAAAVAMEVKLPNPSYFSGRAGLRYSVLGGRLKGECRYHIEQGEKCETDSPLGDIQFISEMYPENGSTSVPTSARIQTVFNFPMDEPFEIEEQNGNDIRIKTFIPFIHEYTVRNSTSSATLSRTISYKNSGIIGVLTPTRFLPGESTIVSKVVVKVKEVMAGGDLKLIDGFAESRTTTFHTDKRPQTLIPDEIESWPVIGQRYFLQDSGLEPAEAYGYEVFIKSPGKKGFIKTRQDYLFKNTPDGDYAETGPYHSDIPRVEVGRQVRYGAVYTSGGDSVIVNVAGNDSLKGEFGYGLEFDIPQLKNSTIYSLKIIRVASGRNVADAMAIAEIGQQTVSKKLLAANKVDAGTLDIVKNKLLSSEAQEEPPIRDLIKYEFRTSKFNNHREKLRGTVVQLVQDPNLPATWIFNGEEAFETIDFATSQDEAQQAFGIGNQGNGKLFHLAIGNWESLRGRPGLHQKFRLYYELYQSFKPFEQGFEKTFPVNVPPSPGNTLVPQYPTQSQLEAALNPLKSDYLAFYVPTVNRIQTTARVRGPFPTGLVTDETMGWPFFRYPYYASSSSLQAGINTKGGRGLVGAFSVATSTIHSGAVVNTGSMAVSTDSGPNAAQVGENSLKIIDKTNSTIRTYGQKMERWLRAFREKVRNQIQVKIAGFEVARLQPLTTEEWGKMDEFMGIWSNIPFADWSETHEPAVPLWGGVGDQPIEFIYMVPTTTGSYPTLRIILHGRQIIYQNY